MMIAAVLIMASYKERTIVFVYHDVKFLYAVKIILHL